MWDLPGPGLEPVTPALAGGYLTTVPPGEPSSPIYLASHRYQGTVMDIILLTYEHVLPFSVHVYVFATIYDLS